MQYFFQFFAKARAKAILIYSLLKQQSLSYLSVSLILFLYVFLELKQDPTKKISFNNKLVAARLLVIRILAIMKHMKYLNYVLCVLNESTTGVLP